MSVLRIQYIDADQDLDPGSTLGKMDPNKEIFDNVSKV